METSRSGSACAIALTDLPLDILLEVFSLLDVSAVGRLSCASRHLHRFYTANINLIWRGCVKAWFPNLFGTAPALSVSIRRLTSSPRTASDVPATDLSTADSRDVAGTRPDVSAATPVPTTAYPTTPGDAVRQPHAPLGSHATGPARNQPVDWFDIAKRATRLNSRSVRAPPQGARRRSGDQRDCHDVLSLHTAEATTSSTQYYGTSTALLSTAMASMPTINPWLSESRDMHTAPEDLPSPEFDRESLKPPTPTISPFTTFYQAAGLNTTVFGAGSTVDESSQSYLTIIGNLLKDTHESTINLPARLCGPYFVIHNGAQLRLFMYGHNMRCDIGSMLTPIDAESEFRVTPSATASGPTLCSSASSLAPIGTAGSNVPADMADSSHILQLGQHAVLAPAMSVSSLATNAIDLVVGASITSMRVCVWLLSPLRGSALSQPVFVLGETAIVEVDVHERTVVAYDNDNVIRVWTVVVRNLPPQDAVANDRDGGLPSLVAVDVEEQSRIDLLSVGVHPWHLNQDVAISVWGHFVVVGFNDTLFAVYNIKQGAVTHLLEQSRPKLPKGLEDVGFRGNIAVYGDFLYTIGNHCNQVHVWNITTGKLLSCHTYAPSALASTVDSFPVITDMRINKHHGGALLLTTESPLTGHICAAALRLSDPDASISAIRHNVHDLIPGLICREPQLFMVCQSP